MAILVLFTGDGSLTKEGYDALRNEVRWHEVKPAGAVVHIASFDEQGNIHVADVWNSLEEFNAFVSNSLMPALTRMQVSPPKVEVYPVHNIDAQQAVSEYVR